MLSSQPSGASPTRNVNSDINAAANASLPDSALETQPAHPVSSPGAQQHNTSMTSRHDLSSNTQLSDVAELQPDNPVQLARALVEKSMLACFAPDTLAVRERIELLHAIGQLTRIFAQRLLQNPDPCATTASASSGTSDTISDAAGVSPSFLPAHSSNSSSSSTTGRYEDPFMLPPTTVAPPRAYFAFRENGRMFLPLIDWSAFRGYSIALWVNVAFLPTSPRRVRRNSSSSGSSSSRHLDAPTATATATALDDAAFSLFRFTNASGSLGVEATIQLDPDDRSSVLLTVRSCHPSNDNAKRSAASIALGDRSVEWKYVQHPIHLVGGAWHLLVLTHSLHYVKKSKVTCFVDTKLQFQDELVYPSGLVTASKCTLGGGSGTAVKLASATMFQDEVTKDIVALLYAQGPMLSSFDRWAPPAPLQSNASIFRDFHGNAVASSPLALPHRDLLAAYCKLHVVFCYTAHGVASEDFADLGVEWISEGVVTDAAAQWVTMESTVGSSAEIQQRNARLSKSVTKVVFSDTHAAWYRVVGVAALPVLLHYILTGYDRVVGAWTTAVAAERTALQTVVEHIVVDVVWIAKGLLLNSVRNQQEVLEHYVLHVLAHVLVTHDALLRSIWTPRSLLVCVELVRSLHAMLPLRRNDLLSANHPLQPIIWTTNPLFASGVRALLLDFRIWTATDVKTQSIYSHQLYGLVCEYPRVFNDLDAVPKVLEILRTFYGKGGSLASASAATDDDDDDDHQQQQQQMHKKRTDEWQQQCVQTLVEILEVCLTNQSVLVHEVKDDEVAETTFARPSGAIASSSSNSASGNGAAATQTTGTSSGGNTSSNTSAGSGTDSAFAAFTMPRRPGGVFSINLENIVWSDQPDASTAETKSQSDDNDHFAHGAASTASMPAPSSVHVRFALVRSLRAIISFLITSDDAVVCRALLLLLRRLAISFLDMRFALVSSNIVDCLLLLMRRASEPPSGDDGDLTPSHAAARMSVALASVPLFIYVVDWLESIEGRTIWCGLDEHLRLLLNGDNSFSTGFLELMMEFYYHPPTLMGIQQSVLMNDATKKESALFPIATSAKAASSIHESGGILVTDDGIAGGVASSASSSSINGLAEWIHIARQFSGKRLSLSWEKRLAVVKLAALRNLVRSAAHSDAVTVSASAAVAIDDMSVAEELFDDGVRDLLSLPLRGVLPFLPVLLGRSSASFREKVLMDLNIKLKTDGHTQQQLLLTKREWAEALLELSIACACPATDDDDPVDLRAREQSALSSQQQHSNNNNNSNDDNQETDRDSDDAREYNRAYSFDANKTSEDLVLDTIVSLLCVAMHAPRGYRSFTDVIHALKSIRIKYVLQQQQQQRDDGSSTSADSAAPALSTLARAAQSELYCASLDWLARVTAIVLQRMARSRTMLSRTLAENVQKLLYLVYETLLALPLRHAMSSSSFTTTSSSNALAGWTWSDAQLLLFNAVLDMCARLIASSHKLHRVGLQPGLQILQRALPFIAGKAMLHRVIDVLVASFQQEMGLVSALRVYDDVPTRDVFLRALVCLRRALLLQERDDNLDVLRMLVLRITTSGSFSDELHAASVTVQALSVMTEANAAIVSLDALALAINETEMHEREAEADVVPHFPVANELRDVTPRVYEDRERPSEAARLPFVDDSEQVLWAALEVEENRMLALLHDVVERDRVVVQCNVDARAARRRAWTHKLWIKQEFVFRSQHQHCALAIASPDALRALLQSQVYRIGLYETPFPGRIRQMLDVDLQSPRICDAEDTTRHVIATTCNDIPTNSVAAMTLAASAPVAAAAAALIETVTKAAVTPRRRQLSLPLELFNSLDFEVAHQSPLNSPNARMNGSLLERVGRVVAEQRGGEIQDITADTATTSALALETKALEDELSGDLTGSEHAALAAEETIHAVELVNNLPVHTLALERDAVANEADDEEKGPAAARSSIDRIGGQTHVNSSSTTTSAFRSFVPQQQQFDVERQYECGLDPSEGVAVTADDQLVARAVCRRVIPEGIVSGTLFLTNEHVAFEPEHPAFIASVESSLHASDTDATAAAAGAVATETTPAWNTNDEAAPGLHRCWRWRYDHIVAVYLRRYRLRDSAIEVFLRNGSTHFLDFPLAASAATTSTATHHNHRNDVVRLLYAFLPRSVPKQWPGRAIPSLAATTKAWQSRHLSNFEYLMALNTFAGRSFNDLTQYPVFPWVVRDFESSTLDLKDPHTFRDLSKPMGALNPTRLAEYWERYHSFDDPVIPKFLYGSHYSTCAGVVLFFLFRLQPFASLQRRMQGGTFDLPDRLFASIQETYRMCNSQMSEVKELTPEFYSSDGAFLRNVNRFALGKRHDQRVVEDVELPPWAATPEEFIRLHRAALESDHVSAHLHEWIDLIFGAKQRGAAALKANNVFYYLTYYGVVDLDRIDDPFVKESMELQIAHFGQCPMQLFPTAHVKRNSSSSSASGVATAAASAVTTAAASAVTTAMTRRSSAMALATSGAAVGGNGGGGDVAGKNNRSSGSSAPFASAPTAKEQPPPPAAAAGTTTTSPSARSIVHTPTTTSTTSTSSSSTHGAAPASSVAASSRPLSLAFHDASQAAQMKRRNWSASVAIEPLVACAIRLIKILPDRVVTVNDLGVIDTYNWKLVAKPPPPPPSMQQQHHHASHHRTGLVAYTQDSDAREDAAAAVAAVASDAATLTRSSMGSPPPPAAYSSDRWATPAGTTHASTTTRSSDALLVAQSDEDDDRASTSSVASMPSLTSPTAAAAATTTPRAPQCPWLIEVSRDDTPIDFIPRMPFHEDNHPQLQQQQQRTTAATSHSRSLLPSSFPLAISSTGRVILSGGGRSGAMHLRLLDLDTGQILAKASVTGHDAAITCIVLDRLSYSSSAASSSTAAAMAATLSTNPQDDDELVVSGSRDGTLALWRLARVKQDQLLAAHRLPRIACSPMLVLRGHWDAVRDASVSTFLGLVVSCSTRHVLVHHLHSDGQVAFVLELPSVDESSSSSWKRMAVATEFTAVRLSRKGYILTVSHVTEVHETIATASLHEDDDDNSNGAQANDEPAAAAAIDRSDATATADMATTTSTITSICQVFNLSGVLLHTHRFVDETISDVRLSAEGDVAIVTVLPSTIRICRLDDFVVVQEYASHKTHMENNAAIAPASFSSASSSSSTMATTTTATSFGPTEAVVLLATGHADGTLVLQLLPDADGSVSLFASLRKMLGVSSKLKIVKGTVQQAQNLAMTTLGNAKAVTSTARDIAGEAIGEAKSIVRGFLTYLQRQSQG